MAFDKDKFWAHVREPIANLLYAGKMKKELKNKEFTILSCNCAAGIIYHRYDHPFLSPTINLWIEQNEFLKFVSNLDYYLSRELRFVDAGVGYPVAECGDIKIWFNHYTEEEDARQRAIVQMAIGTLSYSEIEAVQQIFAELDGQEGLLVASKIADRSGITRSVIVNALRKLESAGVIESRSLGMKGTHIKITNDKFSEDLDNLEI